MSVNIEARLSNNKYNVDEGHPHITIKAGQADPEEVRKLINACPAALYKLNDNGSIQFDYAGCLECGTCRVLCGKTVLDKWGFPRGTFGIEFRFG